MALLGQYLVEQGQLEKDKLALAEKEKKATGESLCAILARLGLVSRAVLREAQIAVEPDALVREGLDEVSVSAETLIETRSAILSFDGTTAFIGTLSPDPKAALARIQAECTTPVRLMRAAKPDEIRRKVDLLGQEQRKSASFSVNDDINDVISALIKHALRAGASDIHIESAERSVHVRYRVDGILSTVYVLNKEIAPKLYSRIKDLSGMDVAEKLLPQDGSFTQTIGARTIDFRVATVPTGNYTEKITMRILDKERVLVDLSELGLPFEDEWREMSGLNNGIILVCGPTGSGKTTTLYSTINAIDKLRKSVYTIEDPIEYQLPFITQIQVNRHLNLDFARILRTLMRHDPDIVVVGEIRDKESAENAMHLADTGHLVYATLHTNDTPSTLNRVKDLGVEWNKLKFVLRGALVQQLVRVLCDECRGTGCAECLDSGYRGRMLVTEFARFRQPSDLDDAISGGGSYQRFSEDIAAKLAAGVTDGREILRVFGRCVVGEHCDLCGSAKRTCRFWKKAQEVEDFG